MKQPYKIILPLICAIVIGISCKKNDYLTDSGIHSAITPLSNYDYLKANSYNLFDTLIMVIDRYKLKDEFNSANTVFAPTDYSIARYMTDRLNERLATSSTARYSLDTLFKYVNVDSIRQYMFNAKITLPELQENETQLYTSLGQTRMGAFKELQLANQYTAQSNNRTYLLYLVRVRGALDVPGVLPPLGEADTRVLCQTTGILTSNGSKVLHALSNQHVFIRF